MADEEKQAKATIIPTVNLLQITAEQIDQMNEGGLREALKSVQRAAGLARAGTLGHKDHGSHSNSNDQ